MHVSVHEQVCCDVSCLCMSVHVQVCCDVSVHVQVCCDVCACSGVL